MRFRISAVVIGIVMATFVWCGRAQAQAPPPPPPPPAFVQTAPQTSAAVSTGKLVVTVQDPSGGVIPGATVAVFGIEDANRTTTVPPVKASDKGVATFDNLKVGRYAIASEFNGFDTNVIRDFRVRTGENKQTITLQLKKITDTVTVTQDKQIAGSGRDVLFGSALTREQIEALPDDPEEMRQVLMQLGGPDAKIMVDSFEGQDLPHKSQIKSIRISRDQFAAEGHYGGGGLIDIITSPGIGAIRTTVGGNFHNNTMEAKNPFAPKKGPAQNYTSRASLTGSLIENKASFSLAINQSNAFTTPNLYAATPTGLVAQNLNLKALRNNYGVSGTLDYAVTKDQTIRIGYNQNSGTTENMGLSNYDYFERAYSGENHNYAFRFNEAGPLGRRFFTNTRFSINVSNSEAHSAVEAPTIRVLDAFTSGGAQQKGGTHTKNFTFNSDLDYVRGKHSWRTGIELQGTNYSTTAVQNYLGTYTFVSLDAFNAGTPRSFTQRVGNPDIDYFHLQGGFYVQDDIRPRKNLSISPGVRFEAQTHLQDHNNVSPRFGFTWSPFKSGKTSVRSSWGVFYDWLSPNLYQQTILNDGFRLKEVNIMDPVYPDPGVLGAAPPVNRYTFGDNLKMVRAMRYSASANQTLNRRTSVSGSFAISRSANLLVGRDLNAPVAGIRPDPNFANEFETDSDVRSHTMSLSTSYSINLSPMSSTAAGASAIPLPTASAASTKLFQWNRGLFLNGNYYYSKNENNTDGAFAVPATGNLALEWGPANFDQRHSVYAYINSSMFKNVNLSINANWSSAPPITIRTGTDDNGDLIFNDRPAGVGRNSARTVSSWDISGFISYGLSFGERKVAAPGGIAISMVNGVMSAATAPAQSIPRYRFSISCSVQNILNHRNPSGFSGVMTSQFFLKPTGAFGQRSANISATLSF